jgi:hypothetical protein
MKKITPIAAAPPASETHQRGCAHLLWGLSTAVCFPAGNSGYRANRNSCSSRRFSFMPSSETHPDHARLADAELDASMTRTDITEALRLLHFGRSNSRHTVAIDGAVRDYIVEALQRK